MKNAPTAVTTTSAAALDVARAKRAFAAGNWLAAQSDADEACDLGAPAATARQTTIQTPLGPRERLSLGAGMYYGRVRRGDKAELIRRGYPRREVRKAAGIRADGLLLVLLTDGYHYDVQPPGLRTRFDRV